MKYLSGEDIRLGDSVKLGQDGEGIVVGLLDSQEFGVGYSQAEWGYLQHGVLVDFPSLGLIHYEAPESDMELVHRADT